MPMNPVVERYISRVLSISVRQFRERKTGEMDEATEKRYLEYAGQLENLPVYYLFGKRSSDSIWENARKMQEKYGLDAIFVDYLQLLTDCNRGKENHSVAVGIVSHNLKAMGQSLNVPVIVASQLNRSIEHRDDKRPMLFDLRESGDIEQDADVVFLLNRPELYPDEYGHVADEDRGVLEIIMAKNRQLGTDTNIVKLQWVADKYHYADKAR
jgi:replicative DNA helicase